MCQTSKLITLHLWDTKDFHCNKIFLNPLWVSGCCWHTGHLWRSQKLTRVLISSFLMVYNCRNNLLALRDFLQLCINMTYDFHWVEVIKTVMKQIILSRYLLRKIIRYGRKSMRRCFQSLGWKQGPERVVCFYLKNKDLSKTAN